MIRSVTHVLLATALVTIGCFQGTDRASTPDPTDDMRLIGGATYRLGTDSVELETIRRATGLETVSPLLPEVPSRVVTVAVFFIDTVDVTNEAFARFTDAHGEWSRSGADPAMHNGRYLEHWTDDGPSIEILRHPVTFVTWSAAVAYCAWRGKRLPTEIEFEWAAQGETARTEYPWGDAPPTDDVVNWGGNGIGTTVPVGSYPPNPRGLYDMAGNVWHFTSDPWLGTYAEMLRDTTGGAGASEDPLVRRVVRGGSWGANAANLRVRYRDSHRPFDAREMVGFRCAMS